MYVHFCFISYHSTFSLMFRFDLCYDFSMWKPESKRCIPKKLNEQQEQRSYVFPPLCNRTYFDCYDDSLYIDYCPNSAVDNESCDEEKPFFCKDSKTCIPEGKCTLP